MDSPLDIVIIGLSITSSWGNGHATTYRSLVRELSARGHRVLFLERDQPWYAENRDLPEPSFCRTELYRTFPELRRRFYSTIRTADVVVAGSYVQEGAGIGEWVSEVAEGVTAFYDIDTPVTLARLERGDLDYLSAALIPKYQLYLSFTGGPILTRLEREFGSPMARALYCSVDPALYYPQRVRAKYDLGYMGTYSDDRQPPLEKLLLEPARRWTKGRFVVAGPQYPRNIRWPQNVRRHPHLPPAKHRAFYNAQRFTLNITRANMVCAGWSPSVRLFEAAACGTPIITDAWTGLDQFFKPGSDILISKSPEETLHYLQAIPEAQRRHIGQCARQRILSAHTSHHRALDFESHVDEARHAALRQSPDWTEEGERVTLSRKEGVSYAQSK